MQFLQMQMGMRNMIFVCLYFFISQFTLSAKEGTIYAVVVGISNYQHLPSLILPERDARMISELYKQQTQHVILLTGRYATKERILQSLRQQFARAKKEDMIVFSFSGHGYPGGICPYDMTHDTHSGLSYEEIQVLLKKAKADRKIVWADACFSGGFRIMDQQETFPQLNHPDILFFLSSRNGEPSIETPLMTNGIFTTYLVRGLRGGADANRDRRITAQELFRFVAPKVTKKSNGRQHPVMWGNFADDFIILDWGQDL